MQLSTLVLRRLAASLPALVVIFLVTFVLVRLGGQDPVGLLAGPTATEREIAAIRESLGLDRSIIEQFLIYVQGVLSGDLGRSWISNRPVLNDILERVPVTLELLVWGVGIGAIVGVTVGLQSAYRRNGFFDQIARIGSLFGFSIPTYFLGLLMLLIFFYYLGWAPPGMGRLSMLYSPPARVTGSYLIDSLISGKFDVAWSAAAQLALPVICIAIVSAAPIVKLTRAVAIDVLSSDYV